MKHKLSFAEAAKIALLESLVSSFGFTAGSSIFLKFINDPLSIPCFFLVWIALLLVFFITLFFVWSQGTKETKTPVDISIKEISFSELFKHMGICAIVGAACWAVLFFISR